MKQPSKKTMAGKIVAPVLGIALLLMLASAAYAKPFTSAFSGGLLQINSFFAQEQYKPYAQAIDFFFFSLLFISVYMIGVRYAFKEVKRPEQAIAILLGLMTAFLLVLGGFSITILLPYMQYLIYALVFIMWWLLLKGIKNKFWRFVLALLLTLLTIGIVQWLYGTLAVPEAGVWLPGFLKSFGESFKGIDFGGIGTPGLPSWLQNLYGAPSAAAPTGPATLPSTTTPTAPAPTERRGWLPGGYSTWNLIWVLPLLAALAYGGFRLLKKRTREPMPPTQPLQNIINKIVEIKTKKNEAKANLERINHEKNDLVRDGNAKQGYVARLKQISKDDIANLFLDESRELIDREEGTIKQIIEKERELVQELKKLRETELELYDKIKNPQEPEGWQTIILRNVRGEIKKPVEALLYILKVLMDQNITQRAADNQKGILWLIAFCYNLEKKQNILAKELGTLFEENYIKDLVKGKFTEAIRDEASLEAYNQRENEIVALLLRRISEQILRLGQLERLLRGQPPQEPQVQAQPGAPVGGPPPIAQQPTPQRPETRATPRRGPSELGEAEGIIEDKGPKEVGTILSPQSTQFFKDLFENLRNEKFDDVMRQIYFGLYNGILDNNQYVVISEITKRIRNNNFDEAIIYLSSPDVKKVFTPNLYLIEEFKEIVDGLKAKHKPTSEL